MEQARARSEARERDVMAPRDLALRWSYALFKGS